MTVVRLSVKQEVEGLLRELPDDTTLDDIQYHLYVLDRIKRGRADIAAGRYYTQDEAKRQLYR
jgi:predicted transcriptional regulator